VRRLAGSSCERKNFKMSQFAKTDAKLADALGISERQLARLKKTPGFPKKTAKGWDIEEVREWRAEQGGDEMKAAKLAEIISRTELNKLKKADLEGRMIPIDEVKDLLAKLASGVRTKLYSLMESTLPPKLEGRDILEVRKILRESADEICAELGAKGEEWLKRKTS